MLTVDALERWLEHGATWRALELSGDRVVVELCTCFGEPVDVLEGSGEELVTYVTARQPRPG